MRISSELCYVTMKTIWKGAGDGDIIILDGVMLITLSRRTAICQSAVEVYLIDVAPLGAISDRCNFNSSIMASSRFMECVWITYRNGGPP